MNWRELIDLAREHAAAPPSNQLQQTRLRLAVSSAYYAVYHALARSNADLLVGASETERGLPEWRDAYMALRGDHADQRLQGDYSDHPEAIRTLADTFNALHHQRLLADEDPSATFTAAEAQAWVERAADAIHDFLSADPTQRRAFAIQILLHPTEAQEETPH